MKLKKGISLLLCIIMVFVSLPDMTNIVTVNAATVKTGTYNIDKDTLPYSQGEIYKQLFDINNKIAISIDMTDEELTKLHKDYQNNHGSPIYRVASSVKITISIPNESNYTYVIDEVGVRLKGNTTREDPYTTDSGLKNIDHYKLSFQETFDKTDDGYGNNEYYLKDGVSTWDAEARKVRKDRTFAKLEKMDVKWNSNIDTTYLREYYAYELFRSEGICAPRQTLTTMNMNVIDKTSNSAYLGVYTIHEPVDSAFIKNNLLDADNKYILDSTGDYTDGDLYKSGWAAQDGYNNNWNGANLTKACTYGLSDDLKGYNVNYDLKTNKKKSDLSPIKDLINGLSSVSSKADLENLVDMNYFVKYAAVSHAIGNWDDMRGNYNNYYVYFYATPSGKQKAIFIPYDFDRAFGVTNGGNPEKTGMTNVDPYTTACAGQGEQKNPLFKYSVDKGGYYISEYTQALKEVMSNPMLSMDTFTEKFNIAKNNYDGSQIPSRSFDNIDKSSFYFTLDTNNDPKGINTTSIDRDDKNIIMELYLTRMMAKCNSAIGNAPDAEVSDCYIRGGFNSWSVNESYKLLYKKASGLYSMTLNLSDSNEFKVYDGTKDKWYGYDEIEGDVPNGIGMGSDSGNIKGEAGTYYIVFDASTGKMRISTSEIETETTTEKETTTAAKETTTTEKETTTAEKETTTTEKETTTAEKETTTEAATKVKITFNANGGKVNGASSYNKTVSIGEKIGSIKTPVKSKYVFSGWYTNKSGGVKVTASTKCEFKEDTTVYAHWTKVKVAKANVSKLTNKKSKKLMITLKKVSGAKGYEISYSTKSNFKSCKKVTSSSLTREVSGVKKGTTYYVKVRAYKYDSMNKKIYGSYSSVKKIKIKK